MPGHLVTLSLSPRFRVALAWDVAKWQIRFLSGQSSVSSIIGGGMYLVWASIPGIGNNSNTAVVNTAKRTWLERGWGLCVFHGFSLVVVEESRILLLK